MGIWKNIRNGFASLANMIRLRQNKVVPFDNSTNNSNENKNEDRMPKIVNKPLMRLKVRRSVNYILPNSEFIHPRGARRNAPILPISDPDLEQIIYL